MTSELDFLTELVALVKKHEGVGRPGLRRNLINLLDVLEDLVTPPEENGKYLAKVRGESCNSPCRFIDGLWYRDGKVVEVESFEKEID